VEVYAPKCGMSVPLADRPSNQLFSGCNLFSLFLFIGVESVRASMLV